VGQRHQRATISEIYRQLLTISRHQRRADRGTVAWDTPVNSFSPETVLIAPYATENATWRDYLAHRTGLPAYGGDLLTQLGCSQDELVRRARYLEFDHSFRAEWAYSNYGIFLG
jgi:CubicO group peptidase (beta-lactamase class C family)